MSKYYNATGVRDTYDPKQDNTLRISRSKIDLFIECPRCFYLEKRLSVKRPPGYPFSLNSAVDTLLKKEFDIHRAEGTPHALMKSYGIDAVPFVHPKLDEWRENFKGVQHYHEESNFTITGAVDDVWVNPEGELIVVDYKSTAKDGEINLDADWQDGYKRQMEVYQWLLRKNGFKVNNIGYFVYCNGQADKEAFDKKLEFEVYVIPYEGDDSWIDDTLLDIKKTLKQDALPESNPECDLCAYRKAVKETLEHTYSPK